MSTAEAHATGTSGVLSAAALALMTSIGKRTQSTVSVVPTPPLVCAVAATALAWMRTRRRDDDSNVTRTLYTTSRAACAAVGFAAAVAMCRDRSASMLACAAMSIAVEEVIATLLLARGSASALGCLIAIISRIATTITAAAASWCLWNLCFVGPASIISPSLIALRARHGTLMWGVMVAPSIYSFVAMCCRALRAGAAP
nr:hypothetical protein [Pandoravirus massiliensis]